MEEKIKGGEVRDIEPEIIDSNSEELDSNEVGQTPSSEAESIEETNNVEGAEDEFAEEPDWVMLLRKLALKWMSLLQKKIQRIKLRKSEC